MSDYLFGVGFLENARYFFKDGSIRNIKNETIGSFDPSIPLDESRWLFHGESKPDFDKRKSSRRDLLQKRKKETMR